MKYNKIEKNLSNFVFVKRKKKPKKQKQKKTKEGKFSLYMYENRLFNKQKLNLFLNSVLFVCLFNGISDFVGYLMANPRKRTVVVRFNSYLAQGY